MNIKKMMTVGIAGIAMGAMALDNVEVTDVKARQRYPWNGLVDIDFTLDSIPTEPYQMQVEVYDNVGKTNLPVKSVYTPNVSFENNPCMVRTDTRRIVWDAAKDLPNGFKCTNVLVTCKDERLVNDSKRYMIVDLTTDPFDVSYTNCPPSGGWKEEHRKTKLVLRRVEPQTFRMGSSLLEAGHADNEDLHTVTLTKPYYIAIYELTEKQFSLIYGGDYDSDKPIECDYLTVRGCDTVYTESTGSREEIKTGSEQQYTVAKIVFSDLVVPSAYCWPNSSDVDPDSLMGKLRARTGGLKFDLPTEAQWECANRAGSAMELNIGVTNSTKNSSMISGSEIVLDNQIKHVGNYLPNAIGLYDMNGNVSEWCRDIYNANLGFDDCVDPVGGEFEIAGKNQSVISAGLGGARVVYSGYSFGEAYNGASVYFNVPFTSRLVKGGDARSASRSSVLIVNPHLPCLTEGCVVSGHSEYNKASHTNPSYGVRVALTVEE